MKHLLPLLLVLFVGSFVSVDVAAQDDLTETDTLFVHTKDGRLDIFPRAMLADVQVNAGSLDVTTLDGSVFKYELDELESYDHRFQVLQPAITSFKFNNKFNHQLPQDVECEIADDGHITGTVGAIGRWLTPSIKLSDKRAHIYVDDTVRVYSKRSRIHFSEPRTLLVAYPDVRMIRELEVKPAVVGEETLVQEPIELTADMLSTNAPSNYPDMEGLDKILDDDPGTFFHSTWGTGEYEKLPEDELPYIQIDLPEAIESLQYALTNRSGAANRQPTVVSLWVSGDGEEWEEVNRFGEAEGFSAEQGVTNTSPVIDLQQPCSHFRIYQLQTNYTKNYFCVAELRFYHSYIDSKETEPAEYAYILSPYGRNYEVSVDWLTERATEVPRVDIHIEDGQLVDSKTEYRNATITIDGAGVFPSMEETPVLIKGRGNSSWSRTVRSKNPYRLKFEEKQKPFGLKKGKNWVLLSNRQTGSMLTNAIGMHAAGIVGTEGANHIIPVELYMNDEYWGSYNFTEKVGLSNNSIELDDESGACLMELDTYYDAANTNKFKTRFYSLPVNVKYPEFGEDETTISLADIKERMDTFTYRVQKGKDISDVVDVEALARFLMVNELILNYELMHPKSTFLYCENVNEDTCKLKFGPVWDLDWGYGYEGAHNYYQSEATATFWTGKSMEATTFLKRLRQGTGEPLDRAMYKTWTRFMRLHFDELLDFVDEYYAYARPSLENNNNTDFTTGGWWPGWSQKLDEDYTDYELNAQQARAWLAKRAPYVYAKLTPYEMTDEEIFGYVENDDPEHTDPYIIDAVKHPTLAGQPTRFNVYDLNGVRLKTGATYDTFRQGLKPGLYIVNGRKVLID
ncbi:MAG: CotH kinase family protein [Bacteroidaceae bacterium]|nr:CotH kinase family protein [Bacteroidaceae bacterium]